MAHELHSNLAQTMDAGAVRRRNPLDNTHEPRMGRMAAVPLAALAVLAAAGWIGHRHVEQRRVQAVATVVIASGHAGPVQVDPIRGDECWRAREGFAWKSSDATGWACAGPGSEVRIMAAVSPKSPEVR